LNSNCKISRLESFENISPNDFIFLSSVARILIFSINSSLAFSEDNREGNKTDGYVSCLVKF